MNSTDGEKIELIREALADWSKGALSDKATLFAIQIITTPPPTEADIEQARAIVKQHPEWANVK